MVFGAGMATKKSVGTLGEADLKGKKVFVRADLNVPLDDAQKITDDTRIRASVPTIKFLLEKGAKVILASHLVSDHRAVAVHVLPSLFHALSSQCSICAFPEGWVSGLANVRFEQLVLRIGSWVGREWDAVPCHNGNIYQFDIKFSFVTSVVLMLWW